MGKNQPALEPQPADGAVVGLPGDAAAVGEGLPAEAEAIQAGWVGSWAEEETEAASFLTPWQEELGSLQAPLTLWQGPVVNNLGSD